MSHEIEKLMEVEDWAAARSAIRTDLRRNPNSHWLLTRLALTYYEQRQYARALKLDRRALAQAPRCPLVLWGLAGSLDMLGRESEAIHIYKRIVRRDLRSLAYGTCGEGMVRARGFHADALYRIGRCYADLGRTKTALRYLKLHLEARGPGCGSIYPIRDVRKTMDALQHKNTRPN